MRALRPRLLAVAHGTASDVGVATVARIVAALRAARPDVDVERCFLDVIEPRLTETLLRTEGPTVLVPLLLSTGYHVESDIPAAVAGHPDVQVARHLGPHPLLVDALVERLQPAPNGTTALVGAGSSRPEARAELDQTADLLAERLGGPVPVLTMGDDLAAGLAAMPRPVHVATYLLAEGTFVDTLRTAAAAVGDVRVGDPLAEHPAVIELIWSRYDDALAVDPLR